MNETIDQINKLEGEIKAHEEAAVKNEQAAREHRALREQKKLEVAQLRRVLNDARVVDHLQTTVKTAGEARAAVDAAKKEMDDTLARLKEKEAQLDAALAKTKTAE